MRACGSADRFGNFTRSKMRSRTAAPVEKAPTIWLAMKRRAEVLREDPGVLPSGTLGKAVSYFLNE